MDESRQSQLGNSQAGESVLFDSIFSNDTGKFEDRVQATESARVIRTFQGLINHHVGPSIPPFHSIYRVFFIQFKLDFQSFLDLLEKKEGDTGNKVSEASR